jgi:hypothetical protein
LDDKRDKGCNGEYDYRYIHRIHEKEQCRNIWQEWMRSLFSTIRVWPNDASILSVQPHINSTF